MEDIGRCVYLNVAKNKDNNCNENIIPIIIVVDGSKIKIITNSANLPTSWIYETKRIYKDVIEYYIRDKLSDTLYCIYGVDAVLDIFPGIINYCDISSKKYYSNNIILSSDDHTQINITRMNKNKFSMEIVKYSTPITEKTGLRNF